MSTILSAKRALRGLLRIVFSRTMLIVLLLVLNIGLTLSFCFGLIRGLYVFLGSMAAFTLVVELIILNSREEVAMKLSWAVLVAVLPMFGALLYFFIRFDLGNRVSRKRIRDSIAASLPWVPAQEAVQEAIRETAPDLNPIACYLRTHANAPAYANTEVTYFPLGEDMFRQLLEELESAERFIYMEYFLVSRGHMWNSILEILERKAASGLDVRVMYDGMNTFTNLPYSYPAQLQKKGIQCKMHAPLRPFVSTHYNNRDHRKITVIDGHTAFTGGVNLEDCYINRESRYGHWKDTALMLRGDAVQSFTLMFLQMWNASQRDRDFSSVLAASHAFPHSRGFVIPYGDGPTDNERVGKGVYLSLIGSARNYLYIMTPYLIADETMITALCLAARRGVDVRMILPHIPDMKTAQILARSHYRDLVTAGVKIYEYTPGFVHAKVFLCDDLHAVVGTINLDYRSLYHHFECAAYLYDVPALGDIRDDFDRTMALSRPVTSEDVKKQSLLSRFCGGILKAFAPLM